MIIKEIRGETLLWDDISYIRKKFNELIEKSDHPQLILLKIIPKRPAFFRQLIRVLWQEIKFTVKENI